MNKLSFTLIMLPISFLLNAQCPDSNEILLRSQSAIAQFTQDFPNCEEFDGTLTIGHFGQPVSTDIKDISALSSFKRVSGTVRIRNCDSLVTLQGLHNLQFVGRDLVIGENDVLKNLDQLSSLDTVAKVFDVYSNPVLDTLFSSDQIKHIAESLKISNNPGLKELNGLGNITSLSEDAVISTNENLESLSGLVSLTSLEGDLDILSNPEMTALTGLDNLTHIGGDLSIYDMEINNLNGLNSLKTIGDDLRITENLQLENLEGLNVLDSIFGALTIQESQRLISITALENLKFIGTSLSIIETALTDLSGLENTAPLNNRLTIEDNPFLESIAQIRLSNVLSSSVNINDNLSLVDISPMMDVDTIVNGLRLTDNPILILCASLCPALTEGEISSIISIRDNGPGCSREDEIITVHCTSNTTEEDLNFKVEYFPNPAIDKLNINSDFPIAGINLFSAEGKNIQLENSQISNNKAVLLLNNLEPGFYFVEIKSKNASHIGRFIKL